MRCVQIGLKHVGGNPVHIAHVHGILPTLDGLFPAVQLFCIFYRLVDQVFVVVIIPDEGIQFGIGKVRAFLKAGFVGIQFLLHCNLPVFGDFALDIVVPFGGRDAFLNCLRAIHVDFLLLFGFQIQFGLLDGHGIISFKDFVKHPCDFLPIFIGILHPLNHFVPALAGRQVGDESAVCGFPSGGLRPPFVTDQLRLCDHVLSQLDDGGCGGGPDCFPANLCEEGPEHALCLTALAFYLLHSGADLLQFLRCCDEFFRTWFQAADFLIQFAGGKLKVIQIGSVQVLQNAFIFLRILVDGTLGLFKGDQFFLCGLEFLGVDALFLCQPNHFGTDIGGLFPDLFQPGRRFLVVQCDNRFRINFVVCHIKSLCH